jgi:predicted lipid carrier protein YhbT
MADATGAFIAGLAERGHEPLLEKARGTVRLEVLGDKRTRSWLLTLERGDVTVSRGRKAADATVRTTEKLLGRLVRGQANALTAFLRGDLQVEGDPAILLSLQRLFPGPQEGPRA